MKDIGSVPTDVRRNGAPTFERMSTMGRTLVARRAGATALLACVAALSFPGGAYAQEAGSLTVEPSTVQDGESIQVTGQCPGAGGDEEVSVLAGSGFEGGLLGRVPISADGAFSGSVTIPAGSTAASGEVSVPCPEGGTVLTAALTIEGPEPQPIGEVPTGGVDSGLGGGAADAAVVALGAAGALLVVGGGTALVVRRRMS